MKFTDEQKKELIDGFRCSSLFPTRWETFWEMPVMLGGPYGLRMSEILGLRWQNVDLEKGVFHVVEQLPYKLPVGTKRSCRSNSLKRKRSKAARRMSW